MIENIDYYIKNTFISTYEIEEFPKLKKSKSLTDLSNLENKDNEIIQMKEYYNKFKIDIDYYTKIIHNNLKKAILKEFNNILKQWKEYINLTHDINLNYYHNKIKECDSNLIFLNDISNSFNKKYIENKNLIKYINELKVKLDNETINYKIIDFLKTELHVILEKNTSTKIDKTNIKTRLNEQLKVLKIRDVLSKIDTSYIKPYIENITEQKNNMIHHMTHLQKTHKAFFKIINKQLSKFIKFEIIKIILDNNWYKVYTTKKITYNINNKLYLGDDFWGNITLNINLPFVLKIG